ncbi:hypothetical protein IKN40_06630 [bacterium]|nr:hypothetical protein [bacterium]
MAFTIGFADEMQQEVSEEISVKKQQDIIDRAKKVMIKIPERRIPEILKGFDCVVVNTFDDDYHLTDEEREKNNSLQKYAKKLKSMKRIYRRLDEYIIAMREHLKFLDKVAEDNGVYDPDEFKMMFMKGDIKIVGLRFPKYKGPNRKDINYKYLTEFILSDGDPKDMLPKWQRDDFDEDEEDIDVDRFFTKEELNAIFSPPTKKESKFDYRVFNADEDSQDGIPIAVPLSAKNSKSIIKNQPEFVIKLKEMKREKRTLSRLSDSFLHNTISEDISDIARYDKNYHYISKSDIPEFHGDVLNDDEYNKYMKKLQEFEDNNVYADYAGKEKTLGEIKELKVKEMLESEGWNLRNFVENREQEEKLKKIQKRDKKKEKQLKKHLLEIQKRTEARKNGEVYKSKKKKKKKKSKDSDKRKSKSEIKDRVSKDFDDILMRSVGANDSTFKEYKERVLDLSDMFGGDNDET